MQFLVHALGKKAGESTKHGPLVHGPPPWTGSMDRVHGPGLSKYGPGPWTPFMDRVHGPPIFTTPKITEVNKNKIKSKVNYK